MEEKKNIRELAVQYFEGRIRRKDEKLLFEYVGQSEANRTAFRQWEKEWIASSITDSNTTKEWETLQRKIRTHEDTPASGIHMQYFSSPPDTNCNPGNCAQLHPAEHCPIHILCRLL